jgi:hypothetical protein
MINSSEQLSSSVGLTTVLTPIFLAVFITLHAISPLFAINILSKGFWVSTTVLSNRRNLDLIKATFLDGSDSLQQIIFSKSI